MWSASSYGVLALLGGAAKPCSECTDKCWTVDAVSAPAVDASQGAVVGSHCSRSIACALRHAIGWCQQGVSKSKKIEESRETPSKREINNSYLDQDKEREGIGPLFMMRAHALHAPLSSCGRARVTETD